MFEQSVKKVYFAVLLHFYTSKHIHFEKFQLNRQILLKSSNVTPTTFLSIHANPSTKDGVSIDKNDTLMF